jgi:uncharacterized protein (DUF1330 family)
VSSAATAGYTTHKNETIRCCGADYWRFSKVVRPGIGEDVMSVYLIFQRLELWDSSFRDEYRTLAMASMKKYGGKYLTVSRDNVLLEGRGLPEVVSILEFESAEQAKRWYYSEDYQQAIGIRNAGSRSSFILLETKPR